MTNWIWVFHGNKAFFASAVFSDLEKAEEWISKHFLSGTLTKMPIDQSIYEWTIQKGMFIPKNEQQKTPDFIQRFSSAYLEHYHYENGKNIE